ncbi:PmV-like protein [Homarus gammarus nudivirus]|uniref:PmV-like protein n=1 Tax=Homarus gammarus nudivirus TaxID=2509616 RepID=A0A411HB67_9VIRU|nr:PmV-like protein [Homarus gammarus nudivirus]QBB28638.1 PmV-like protein [Homarus gammarus nudivirus]
MSCSTVFDTFESLVIDRIKKSLHQDEFEQLNLNMNEWSDLYVKLFINLYIQICGLAGISLIRHNTKNIEPVTLHVDVHIARSENKPTIIHSISLPFLKYIFNTKSYTTIQNSALCAFKMPSVFPISNGTVEDPSYIKLLNMTFSNRILLYYTYADHAAYHYHQFIKTGDADYKHINIINRPSKLRPNEVMFCHDIISKQPNKYLGKYLKPHDMLKIEDEEAEHNYFNGHSGTVFENSDDDSE